jgi:hypothetical protein
MMAIIRTAKGLQEANAETLKDRMQRLDLPQTTSAAQADALGATAKQADMAGTQARKQAVIKENLAPKQDQLPLSQRYAQQQAALTGGQQQQLTEAQRLAQLAGLDTRIQKLVEERVNQAGQQPVQRQASETELSKVIPMTDARYQQAAAALADYANDPAKQEQALVTLQNLGITPAQVTGLLETTDAALGRAADPTAIRGSDLDASLKEMGYAGGVLELSQQLGKDVSTLGVEDLVKEVQAYRNKVTAEKEKLEAQALGQTGMQQQAAMTQLGQFYQAGGVGQEQAVERALQPIDMAATVKVGEEDMRVDQLLQDQEFSDLIEQWAISSPEEREKLIPSAQFGGLVQWMTQNEQAIKQAAQAGQQAQQQFGQTQQQVQQLGADAIQDKNLIAALVPGFDKTKAYTASDLANFQQQLQSSPAYQFAKSSPEGRAYINSFKPEELPQLQGMNMTDLQQQANAYTKVKGSPGLQSRYDLDPSTKVYSQSQLNAIDNFTRLPTYLQTIGTDPDFKSLTIDQLKYFDRDGQLNGEMVDEFKQFLAEQKAMIAESDDAAVTQVFGGTAQALNDKRKELEARAAYGDQDAVQALQQMKQYDVTGGPDGKPDGVIDAADARQLAAARKAELAGKDADYFRQQYGTGSKGYQTLAEQTNAGGQGLVQNTAKGIYSELQDAITSGDFSRFTESQWGDPASFDQIDRLIKAAQTSGLSKDSPTIAKLNGVREAMKDKYLDNVRQEADSLLTEDRNSIEAYSKILSKYKTDKHPMANWAYRIGGDKLRTLRSKVDYPAINGKSTDKVAKGAGKAYDDLALAIDPTGKGQITVQQAQALREFMSSKTSKDPTFRLDLSDKSLRNELVNFGKARGNVFLALDPNLQNTKW